MGKHGFGSIALRSDGRWQASLMRNGRRRYRTAATREAAEQRLTDLRNRIERGSTDGLRAASRRERAIRWTLAILDESRRQEWPDTKIAHVLIAQLAPSRIKRDVFGPCVYCGSWIAGTIDHVIPRSKGGSDEPANLASACWSCNIRKHNREASSMAPAMAVGEGSAA